MEDNLFRFYIKLTSFLGVNQGIYQEKKICTENRNSKYDGREVNRTILADEYMKMVLELKT